MSDAVALLVADVPWAVVLPALSESSGETFEVRAEVTDDAAWQQECFRWRCWSLPAGAEEGGAPSALEGTLGAPGG